MIPLLDTVGQLLLDIPWTAVLLTLGTLVAGLFAARLLSNVVRRQVERRTDRTTGMISQKLVFYGLIFLAFLVVLRELDVSLGALLAAGGLIGVALGFASQTAVSNIISGIFLMFERPFEVADIIRVDTAAGVVQSIDLLSTKIRTFDNLYWRIPNEKLLKNDITTITKYDIRRLDVVTSISYEDDIGRARSVLEDCAEEYHLILGDPEPVTLVNAMGDSGIELTLRCWFHKPNYLEVMSEITRRVKVALEEAGCTIPFPHRTVYVREETEWSVPAGDAPGSSPETESSPGS